MYEFEVWCELSDESVTRVDGVMADDAASAALAVWESDDRIVNAVAERRG